MDTKHDMRIGIDISQIVHEGTGVGRYVREMVRSILNSDTVNEYVLFGASLRKRYVFFQFFTTVKNDRVTLVTMPIPPTILDFLWNTVHGISIERFIGHVDVFWSSDWTQPPLNEAKGITTIHDVSFLHFPESFDEKIVAVQKRRLAQAKKECAVFLCDSETTKQDVKAYLQIDEKKLRVVYPGFRL